jgi:hypothetical protein
VLLAGRLALMDDPEENWAQSFAQQRADERGLIMLIVLDALTEGIPSAQKIVRQERCQAP